MYWYWDCIAIADLGYCIVLLLVKKGPCCSSVFWTNIHRNQTIRSLWIKIWGPSYLLGKVKTKIRRDFAKNIKDVLVGKFSSITFSPDYYTWIACSIDNRIGHKAIFWWYGPKPYRHIASKIKNWYWKNSSIR